MTYLIIFFVIGSVAYAGWKITNRNAYETAEYQVVAKDSPFEIRKYTALTLVTTPMRVESQGNDGSFGRLFSYISGNNESEQSISMTTPVFMDMNDDPGIGNMAFVIPNKVPEENIPLPKSEQVTLRDRSAGRFAVYRFAGRINQDSVAQAERKLRTWIENQGFSVNEHAEVAGYDPPWTPGPFRRNEVLIELVD